MKNNNIQHSDDDTTKQTQIHFTWRQISYFVALLLAIWLYTSFLKPKKIPVAEISIIKTPVAKTSSTKTICRTLEPWQILYGEQHFTSYYDEESK